MGTRRFVLQLAIAALGLALSAPISARASVLRRIVPSIDAFASDGTRYVAWEAANAKTIVVFDTRTGRRRELKATCPLKAKAPAAAARFLLECGEEERALLDARSGAVRPLPFLPPHPYAEYGPIWEGVGLRYVIGRGGTSARCHRHGDEKCFALYDIATHAVLEVAESDVPDPDRPGAPRVCPALRSRVLKASRMQGFAFEGFGPLTPLNAYYGYSDGRFVEGEGFVAEREPNLVRHWVIASCKGTTTVVTLHAERRNLEPFDTPELDGDLLTWSTGHLTDNYEAEEEAGPGHGNLRHGILGSYGLRTHRRQLWMLPPLRFHVTRYLSGKGDANVVGTFGYSAHTDYDAFWIAARTAECTAGETGCSPENVVSALYGARL